MAEIKIDKGVPMPRGSSGRGRPARYPWLQMEVGDCFLVPPDSKHPGALIGKANEQYAPRRFASRKTPEGHRIWRIA